MAILEPAPLIETAAAKAPPGAEASWFVGAAGARMRAALFVPQGQARGSVVLSGGRTEPIEKYYEVIGELLQRGLVVLAHDWRGQGLSHRDLPDPLKGHARGYQPFLQDFRALLSAYGARLPRPWIAIGHSMGGCLTLLAMAKGVAQFDAALLSAPMLSMRLPFPRVVAQVLTGVQIVAGRAGHYTLTGPGQPFDAPFEGNALTHDRARYDRMMGLIAAEPRLALGGPTWGWIDFALRATGDLARPGSLEHIAAPVIILSAEADALVDNAGQLAIAGRLPQGEFVNVPGAYHEILMETDSMRNIFLRALDALLGRTAPEPAAPAPKPAATPAPVVAPVAPAAAQVAAPKAKAPKAAAKKAPAAKPASKAPAPAKAAPKASAAKKPAPKAAPAPKPAATKAQVTTKTPVAKSPTVAKPAAKASAPKKPAPKAATTAKAAAKPAATAAKAKAAASPKPAAKAAAPKNTAAPMKKPAAKKR